ncbi:MAG: 3-oxoacid CoA-transferase subunit B [Trueperaceae bacterium]|nr:3-oxoacid CoA-transferase subunit B [Trueperaceae bacterium]
MTPPDSRAAARARIAARAALEVASGNVVNLGIGLPTEVGAHLPQDGTVRVHAENGILGMGPAAAPGAEDPDLIDAGGRYVTVLPGAAYLDSVTSFALVRGGRVGVCILGAFEVDVRGDLANWRVPGRAAPGVGGAMELAQKVPRVIITTLHTDRNGAPKLVERCTLPRTARAAVTRIVTERAVLAPAGDRFRLLELAPGITLEELRAATGAEVDASEVCPWRGARAESSEEGAHDG